jgi:hypothetical protein
MAIAKGLGGVLVAGAVSIGRFLSGPSRVVLDTSIVNHVASLTAYSVHGSEVTIHCQATYFRREFSRWWMPSKRMAVYSMSAIVPPDAPPRLRDVIDFTINIPRECTVFTREVYQKQRAVEAYLDLLLAKMDRRQTPRKWW